MSTCFALRYPIITPAMRLIESITQSNPAIITTTFPHGYITGTIVRLDIPTADGMPQINQQIGTITVTGASTFTMPIDSTTFQPFEIPSSPMPPSINTCAQVIPIGEDNDILTAAVRNVLPFNHY
jgi:hypothetical protein